MSTRTLIDRWHAGQVPREWAAAHAHLNRRLGTLERILGVLHGAVEYPAPSLAARVECSTNTSITTTALTDITGATVDVTPEVDGDILVIGHCDVQCATFSAATDLFTFNLSVNGVAQAYGGLVGLFTAANQRAPIHQQWIVPVLSGTTYTLKLGARQVSGTSTYTVMATRTGFVFIMFPSPYQVP